MSDNPADSRCMTDAIDRVSKMKLDDGLDDDTRQLMFNRLRDKNYYENVFSWDMRNASKNSENDLEFLTIDKIQKSLLEHSQINTYENGLELFSLYKYCFKLMLCYEYFTSENYDESLLEVEDSIKYIETITFDESSRQYIPAYYHMAQSTYAFISKSMNLGDNCEKVMKNLKLLSELSNVEKSAIHAVKALIFMKYPSMSKHTAFYEAEEAYKLNSTDIEWMHIWLKAKGPLNREFNNFEKPNNKEIKIAENLSSIGKTFWHFMVVSDVFLKVFKCSNNVDTKNNYFDLAFKNMSNAIKLAGNNKYLIIKCLKVAIDQPKLLLSKSTIEEKIKILKDFKHHHLSGLIGNYYLRHIKDYETAKNYFIHGQEMDYFCVLKMLQVECILKPLDEIPILETLTNAYHKFINSKGRVKILSQILFYCTYHKEDKIIDYFILFMDQPFDHAFKYRHLISIIPIFKIEHFQREQFVVDLFNKVEYIIKNHNCNSNEKKMLNDTLENFSKIVAEALDDIYLKQLSLNYLNTNLRAKLIDIIKNYESIFSWKIIQQTENKNNLLMNLIDKIREKLEQLNVKNDDFNECRFYYWLVLSHEFFVCGNYNEALMEVERAVKYVQSCKFNITNVQFSDAYIHIAQTSFAFIALTLNLDSKMEDIKPANSLNQVQRAAICALKAQVFLEYPPKGNFIALNFVEQARILNSTEPEYIAIWLKAKGRTRRHNNSCSLPGKDELDAAEFLCSYELPSLLLKASQIYSETAFYYKCERMHAESSDFYTLSSDLILKAIELAKDDTAELSFCLLIYVEFPIRFQLKSVVESLIQKLSNIQSSCLNQALGQYYLKQKDYEKAKIYLSQGMFGGSFRCSLQLIKVECLLQPVNEFPLVNTLNMFYDVFKSPKRRLIILSQSLLFYYYIENNPKEMIHYLKLYMDQDIDDSFKKQNLIDAYPKFKVPENFKPKSFYDKLFLMIKNLKSCHNWCTEEKETFDRFDQMSKLNICVNKHVFKSKSVVHKQYVGNIFDSNQLNFDKTSYNNKNNECNWRKQQDKTHYQCKRSEGNTNWRL